jgi:hypothetical protein
MSIELVLFVVAFLLLPLLQHLVRAARVGQEARPAQPGGPQSSAGVPPLEEQQFVEPEDRTSTDETAAPRPKPAQKPHRPVAPATGGSAGRGRSILAFRKPLELRRAIVLRTVLGPCRASNPQDWPEPD